MEHHRSHPSAAAPSAFAPSAFAVPALFTGLNHVQVHDRLAERSGAAYARLQDRGVKLVQLSLAPCAACHTCPGRSSENDEAAFADNTGCLPEPLEMLAQKMFENHDWECHSRPGRRCASYAVLARAAGFDPLSGTLIGEITLRV